MKRVLLLGILSVLLTATACGGGVAPTSVPPTQAPIAPTLPSVPTAAPTATQPPVSPTSANPLDALTKAFRGFGGVKSFRSKITTTVGTGAAQEMTLDVVMPDRFHIVSKQIDAYLIASTFYMKAGNQWQKMALPKSFDLSFVDAKKLQAELQATTETKLIGPDVLDGTPTLVYQYTTTIKTPTTTTSTAKVWIGVADGLPRKMESASQTGMKTVATYYDYNANITIEPPIK